MFAHTIALLGMDAPHQGAQLAHLVDTIDQRLGAIFSDISTVTRVDSRPENIVARCIFPVEKKFPLRLGSPRVMRRFRLE